MSKAASNRGLRESYRLVDSPVRRVCVFSNGLTAIIHRHEPTPVSAVRVYVRAGSVFEGRWTGTGISHLLEHAVTSDAAGRRSEKELLDLCDAIGGLVNAYTTADHICHLVTTTPDHIATAVEMFADYIVRPALSQAVFDRELGVVQRELERDRDDPDTQLEEMLHEALYRGHPMQYPVIGHREGLVRLTLDDLVGYHRRAHVPENVVVVIVGDVDLDEAMGVVGRAFAGFERGPRHDDRVQEPLPLIAPVRAIKEMDVESASMTMAWLTRREGTADDAALDLLASVLTEGDSARMVRALRWERELVYELSGTHDSSWHTPGILQVSAQCEPDRLDDVRDAVLEILDDLDSHPVTPAELDRAKRQHLTAIRFHRETAEGLAAQLGEDFLATGNVDYSDVYISRIQNATVVDLMRVARQYLERTAHAFAAVVPTGRQVAKPPAARASTSPGLQRFDLDNGLTCVVRPMPRSAFVAVSACFIGGVLAETEGTNGVFNLMIQALVRGTPQRTGTQIAEMFASRGSSIGAGSGLNQFGCSFVAPAEDFRSLFEVMAEIMRTPAFDRGEVDKVRPAICDEIARLDEDWNSELMRFARRSFFEFSPYRMSGSGTIANVRGFTPNVLRETHRRFMTGSNGVLSIAGRVDPQQVRALAEQFLGELPHGEGRLLPDVRAEPCRDRARFFVKKAAGDREVAGLFIGFPGLSVSDRRDRAAVAVLEAVLAGYSLSGGRLYSALRGGDRNMVYEVAGSGMTGLLPGYIAFTAGCEPNRVAEVHGVMRAEIDSLRDGRLDTAELERVRSMVLTGELDQLQSPTDFAGRMGVDEAFGLGACDWEAFLDEVRGVTTDDVIHAARKYLNHATVAVVTPEPGSLNMDPA